MNLTRLLLLLLFVLISFIVLQWNQIYLFLFQNPTNNNQHQQPSSITISIKKQEEVNLSITQHPSTPSSSSLPISELNTVEEEADFRYRTTPYRPVGPGLGFINETSEQFNSRHRLWKQVAKELTSKTENHKNIRYIPYGIQQIPGLPFMVRTAIVVSETVLMIVPVDAPRQVINHQVTDHFFLNGSCEVGVSRQNCSCVLETCRCLTHSRNPLKGNTQMPKIICRLREPIDMSGARSMTILGPLEANQTRIRVEFPIEPLPKKTDDLHVCYQQFPYSLYWQDKIPVELVEYNIAHHHRLGATHFHLFSKTLQWSRTITSLKVPETVTVWIHDYPIPPTYEIDVNQMNAFQQIMANECLTRARAMGARYLAIGDFDEFIFPHNNQTTNLAREFDSYPQNKSIFWMYSHEYHPKICLVDRNGNLPQGTKNFLDHMVLPLDPATAPEEFHPEHLHGSFRMKAIVRIETIEVELLAKLLWLIHSVTHADIWKTAKNKMGQSQADPRLAIEVLGPSPKAYIRHFRRIWLPGRCMNIYEEGKPLPRGTTMVDRPPAILPPIEITNLMRNP
jgi:hypothetical protein